MEEVMTASGARAGRLSKTLIRGAMRVMFRPVFGWTGATEEGIERFDIAGVDGSSLNVARRLPVSRPFKGVVILCHPFLKYGMHYFFRNGYDAWLSSSGYVVLAFNFKGFGSSSLGGIAFHDDVSSMVDWARAVYPGLPVHLYGLSFGGYHGLHALGAGRLNLSSVVADSVPPRIDAYFDNGLLGVVMRWFSRSRWAMDTGTRPIVASLRTAQRLPLLFLYGKADEYLTASDVAQIQAAYDCVDAVCFDRSGHLELNKKHEAEYRERVIGFLDRNSAGQPVSGAAQ